MRGPPFAKPTVNVTLCVAVTEPGLADSEVIATSAEGTTDVVTLAELFEGTGSSSFAVALAVSDTLGGALMLGSTVITIVTDWFGFRVP